MSSTYAEQGGTRVYKTTIKYADNRKKIIRVRSQQTIMEAAEEQGIALVSGCQSGVCGTCVAQCREGAYEMGHVEGLGAQEKQAGKILTCQTVVKSDCVIEVDYPEQDNAARLVSGEATVSQVRLVSETTAFLSLNAAMIPGRLDFKPGQFAQLLVPGTEQWRSYSYAHMPNENNQLQFIIRLLPDGVMSNYLRSEIKIGDRIQIRGSKGTFYLRPVSRPIVLMAGGTGLSAILAMLEQLASEQVSEPVRLYYGVSFYSDLCKMEELNRFHEKLRDFKLIPIVGQASPDWQGPTGLITDALDSGSLFSGNIDLYLCGPPAMVDATRRWLAEHGLNNANLFSEKFIASGPGLILPPKDHTPAQLDLARLASEGRGVAVVIGGSIAGISAAKVLSEKFSQVVVLEKDSGHNRRDARPGAAQGWHLHHLLLAGQNILEEIFPGIIEDMVREGAFKVDTAHQYRILMAGSWKQVFKSGLEIICAGRPLLEWCVRRRLDTEESIDYRYDSRVEDLSYDPVSHRILGVVVNRGGQREIIPAEFVVDASGKNTLVPEILSRQGIGAPEVEEDCINAFYSTMHHKVPRERQWRDKVMVICYAFRPHQEHYTAQYYLDSSRTVLSTSLVAYNCDTPPRNHEEFKRFAKLMPSPVIAEAIDGLEPCSPVYNFRYPNMLRYQYEKMPGLPGGLVSIGDSYCSADPVSGAGMTKALLEINELKKLLPEYDADSPILVKKYYRKVSKIADRVWFVIREQNLRYPWIKDVDKKRPFYFGPLVWYVNRIIELSHEDKKAYRQWLAVTHFISPPASLFLPGMAGKAIGKWLGTKLRFRKTLIERNFESAGLGGRAKEMP